MKRLYVGTEQGLLLLSEDAQGWRVDHSVLRDTEIAAVAKRPVDGKLLVATRRSGLQLVDPEAGRAEQMGAGVLPPSLRCVAVAPSDPKVVYVGCEPAAIYKSVDGGSTWTECEGVRALARQREWKYHISAIPSHVRHILVDRRTPDWVYAAVQIGGVILSKDGGVTWVDVTESIDDDVHTLVQDAENADRLYAATGGGGPIGGPHPPVPPNGYALYCSDDAGLNWRPLSAGLERQHAVPLHIHPRDPATLVVALARGVPPNWRRAEGADAVLMVSRNRGESWGEIAGGLPDSFRTMVDSIDTEPGESGRTYLGVGGEGTKVLPAEYHRGSVYYAEQVQGPWKQVPLELPTVFTVTAG